MYLSIFLSHEGMPLMMKVTLDSTAFKMNFINIKYNPKPNKHKHYKSTINSLMKSLQKRVLFK